MMERKASHLRASTARGKEGLAPPRGPASSPSRRCRSLASSSRLVSSSGKRPLPARASAPNVGVLEDNTFFREAEALSPESRPVPVARRELGVASSFDQGAKKLSEALRDISQSRPEEESGVIRLEVTIPREGDTIGWLRGQSLKEGHPVIYFSPKTSTFGEGLQTAGGKLDDLAEGAGGGADHEVGCVGSTCLWQGRPGSPFDLESYDRISRFLSEGGDAVRAFGGIRFDPTQTPSEEWEEFGSYTFVIPSVELRTTPSHSTLACNIAWDNLPQRTEGERIDSIDGALSKGRAVLSRLRGVKASGRAPVHLEASEATHDPTEEEWDPLVNDVLGRMSKLVLARRSKVTCRQPVDALHMLSCLQDQDRKGYQFCMLLDGGSAFFGNTPERLYARAGGRLVSEAVAATTRVSKDASVTKDLLTSEKEHNEFIVVRDAIKQALESLCTEVEIEAEKQVLKHVNVQHLYGRLSGKIARGKNDFHFLSALHPTPAVAGYPCEESVEALASMESFDRGLYSGPFGWMSGSSSEFAVAIRSALVQNKPERGNENDLVMYAGVGIVDGSKPDLEWKELDLKVQQFSQIVRQGKLALESFPNANALSAFLVVEELCRLGVKYFCIAPGSRSTPLVLAAANHPRAEVITCIDERSLGFFALGIGKGKGVPAAVITTSGTAVANLLPAVVEASESNVPLLVLTADRPAELQGTGANQTIDQMHIYGKFPRWFRNFPAPTPELALSDVLLTNLSTAYRYATHNLPGPVHLNFQYREPLAPIVEEWDRGVLDGKIRAWADGGLPYTTNMIVGESGRTNFAPWEDFMDTVSKCKKGLIIVGTSTNASENLALIETAQRLGWPLVPDISSGLKLGSGKMDSKATVIYNLDHILLDAEASTYLQPECIIQVGREPVSKRISNFISKSCQDGNSKLVILGNDLRQRDPSHIASYQLMLDPVALNDMVRSWSFEHPEFDPSGCKIYCKYILELDHIVSNSVNSCFERADTMSEPLIARVVSEIIPRSNALFLGNSMPIRDMEMSSANRNAEFDGGLVALGSNRGSSGIDGVTSSAAGFAESLGSPVTLLIGDVSFVHDSNGLNLLSGPSSSKRAPLTIIVVNNRGGRIFEMLPVAQQIDSSVLDSCFITDPEADVSSLCRAYRIPHQLVSSKEDMIEALRKSWRSKVHNVIEISVDPQASTEFRNFVKERVKEDLSVFTSQQVFLASHMWSLGPACIEIDRLVCEKMSYPLAKELTTSSSMAKEMVKVSIQASHKDAGKVVTSFGEVSPLENLHRETLKEAQSQLACVSSILPGKRLPLSVAALDGSLERWFSLIGIEPDSLLPSVRFGLESALLDLLSSALGYSVMGGAGQGEEVEGALQQRGGLVHVIGLLSSDVATVVEDAERLVSRGYRGIKLKVGRSEVEKDIEMVRLISQRFGSDLVLRCDANRAWTLDEALTFADGVKGLEIEFIEEPVKDLADLEAFTRAQTIPVALDEHLSDRLRDTAAADVRERATELMSPLSGSLDAVVLKPSVLGSVEKFKSLVDLCVDLGVKPIVSSAFDSSVGLRSLSELALYVDSVRGARFEGRPPLLHGLGTIAWNIHEPREGRLFLEEATSLPFEGWARSLVIDFEKQAGPHKALPFSSSNSIVLYDSLKCELDHDQSIHEGFMKLYKCTNGSLNGHVHASAGVAPSLAFVHGFLGDVHDWLPLISSTASTNDCYAVSLPGHSSCTFECVKSMALQNTFAFASRSMSELLDQSSLHTPILVAYSMGARIALDMVLSSPEKYSGLMIISSSPGIKDEAERENRAIKDLMLSAQIRETRVESFLDSWYKQPLFESFSRSPQFMTTVSKRAKLHESSGLADAMGGLSPGLQDSLWPKLRDLEIPLCVVCGELDPKYVSISEEMCELARESPHLQPQDVQLHVVSGAGHCVHLEAPQAVAPILSNFVSYVERSETTAYES
ncbi:menaquinone biosynthesis protein [Chloropicon primus]|uniref:isochorismate synthase n=4 Tax=Chloropicon primus TaxID=1764295 RepID=A0A5B8MNV4_9CHLO|nr:menaquinone biosynthesis protein [Chloropicon primus]|eukprot:QDZ21991.1 menaquinone biosynthesis protein [Chloropicon primus]